MSYLRISKYVEAIKFAEYILDQFSPLRPALDEYDIIVISSGNFA